MEKEMQTAINLLAMIDSSRRNVERALKVGNYYSAAHVARGLAAEAVSLANIAENIGNMKE